MVLPISRPERNDEIRHRLSWREWQPTLFAGGVSLLLVVTLIVLFDGASPFERAHLLQGFSNSVFWLAASMIGACGTIAALTLTTLSLMQHLETRRMGPRFLFNMRLTVLASFATISLAILVLLLTIFPSVGTDEVTPAQWQVDALYYAMLAATALMVGCFAVVLNSLYGTIADVFRNLPESWLEDILAEDEEEEREERERERREKERAAAGHRGIASTG